MNRLHLLCLPSCETEVRRSVFGEEAKAIVSTQAGGRDEEEALWAMLIGG